jgi:hypothetical protein
MKDLDLLKAEKSELYFSYEVYCAINDLVGAQVRLLRHKIDGTVTQSLSSRKNWDCTAAKIQSHDPNFIFPKEFVWAQLFRMIGSESRKA